MFDDEYGWCSGYDGCSMSWNARLAYATGERPLSRWHKEDIIEAVCEINPDIDISRLTLKTLKKHFLSWTSWHHTGYYYRKTDFYSVNEGYVEDLRQADIDKMYEAQKTKRSI